MLNKLQRPTQSEDLYCQWCGRMNTDVRVLEYIDEHGFMTEVCTDCIQTYEEGPNYES